MGYFSYILFPSLLYSVAGIHHGGISREQTAGASLK